MDQKSIRSCVQNLEELNATKPYHGSDSCVKWTRGRLAAFACLRYHWKKKEAHLSTVLVPFVAILLIADGERFSRCISFAFRADAPPEECMKPSEEFAVLAKAMTQGEWQFLPALSTAPPRVQARWNDEEGRRAIRFVALLESANHVADGAFIAYCGSRRQRLEEALRALEEREQNCREGDCLTTHQETVRHQGCDGHFCAHGFCQECGSEMRA